MDGWFIVSIILGIIALGAFVWWVMLRGKAAAPPQPERSDFKELREYSAAFDQWKYQDRRSLEVAEGRTVLGAVAIVATGVAGLFFFLSLWVIVPTNKIGIVTEFGKPTTAIPNGWQWKAPWANVTEFDASRQFMKFGGKGNDEVADADNKQWPAIPVKMDKEATAAVYVTVSWQMKAGTKAEKDQAVELFRNYKTFPRLTENFMAASVRSAMQATYANVNPLVADKNPSFAELSVTAMGELKKIVGTEVVILSVQVTGADYDDKTDGSIKDMQAEFARTELAIQQKETNRKISEANAALVSSLSDEILKDACVKGAIAAGQNPGACLQPGWGNAAGTAVAK